MGDATVGHGGGDSLKLQMYRAIAGEGSDAHDVAEFQDIRDWYRRVTTAPSESYSLKEVTRERCLSVVGFLLRRVAALELENKELRKRGGSK